MALKNWGGIAKLPIEANAVANINLVEPILIVAPPDETGADDQGA